MVRTTKIRSVRGITIIDTLAATLIITVAMLGSFGIFWGVTSLTARTSENSVAESLARREIEEARSQGFYWCTTPATGVGCDGTTTHYYDSNGAKLASSSGARFTVTTAVTSSSLTSGVPDNTALRTLIVTVTRTADSKVLETTGSYLAWGGV